MLDKLNALFLRLEKEFPYPPTFKGCHGLGRDRQGRLVLTTFIDGQFWRTGLEEGDLDDLDALMAGIHSMVTEFGMTGGA